MDLKQSNLCRVCLLNDADLISIFQDDMSQSIMSIANVKIDDGDGFPGFICGPCSRELKSAVQFKRKCELSHKALCTGRLDGCVVQIKVEPDVASVKKTATANDDSSSISSLSESRAALDAFKPYEILTREFEDSDGIKSKVTVYRCVECGRPELSSTQIQGHACDAAASYDLEVFRCAECAQLFVSSHHYRSHMGTAHRQAKCDEEDLLQQPTSSSADLQCYICNKKCRTKRLFKTHIEGHSGDQAYVCAVCSRGFASKLELRRHTKEHNQIKIYQCKGCVQKFTSPSALAEHEGTQHHEHIATQGNGEKHQCETCGKFFSHRAYLLRHIKIHNGDKPHECRECGKRFIKNGDLVTHLRVHTGEKPFTCEECGASFRQQGNLREHVKRMHRRGEFSQVKKFECHICHKRCRNRSTLSAHIETHSGERNYPCDQCPKAFMTQTDLRRHLRLHDRQKAIQAGTYVVQKRHKCDECGKAFTFRCDLLRHLKRHRGDKQHECRECGKRFVLNIELTSHMRVHTGEKPFTCDECGVGFAQKYNLKTHIARVHRKHLRPSGAKSFQCDICTNSFKEIRYLKAHMRMHTLGRTLPCPECDKAFVNKSSLTQHLKKHDRQKAIAAGMYVEPAKHQCETCGKFFNYRYELVKHTKRHVGDKQHVCQQCGKGFVSNPELIIHLRVHSGEKPFTCDECGLSFAQQGNYSSHVKRIHKRGADPKQNDQDKKFQCHICYNKFKSVRYLRTHIRMHTGERNFPCTACEKAFVTKSALNRHSKRHDKEKNIESAYVEPAKYACLYNVA